MNPKKYFLLFTLILIFNSLKPMEHSLDNQFVTACLEQDLPNAKELLAKGAHINYITQYGNTILNELLISLLYNLTNPINPEMVKFLAIAKDNYGNMIDINHKGFDGCFTLIHAIRIPYYYGSKLEIKDKIIDYIFLRADSKYNSRTRLNINQQAEQCAHYFSSLMVAVKYGYEYGVKKLLEHNAHKYLSSASNHKAIHYAERYMQNAKIDDEIIACQNIINLLST